MEKKANNAFLKFCEIHSFKPKTVLIVLAILILIIAANFFSFQKIVMISKTSSLGLKDIGELATQAGYFTTVQTIDKSRNIFGFELPGTQSTYVYSYDGTIKAGIDFKDIDMEVDEQNKVIKIRFPEFRILSTEIDDDSFILYNDGANLFTSLKVEDIAQANAELKKAARESANKNGIFENARANAEVLVKGFLASMYNLNEYNIEFLP